MEVYLLKNVAKIGLEGEIIKVGDGFARNFLIPQKMAIEITAENKDKFQLKIKKVENRKEAIASEMTMLAETLKTVSITLKRKMHENGQLYGSVAASEIAEALDSKGFKIGKSQIEIEKPIKAKGTFSVTVKLSNKIKSTITVVVVAE
jgi:large subunit ribosomal protein L9